jgi:hypothetical protein
MNRIPTKGTLSPARKRLLQTMQELNFGRIENITVCAGEPMFTPALRVIRDIKIGGENGPRPEASRTDFALKAQFAELFEHLSQIGDGSVSAIEVKHGLPFRLVIEEPVETS